MTMGEVLVELRLERNIGQKELASYLNMSIGTVSNYENDVHSPDLNTLCRLAEYYGVTTDYLLGRTKYRFNPQLLNKQLSQEYTVTDIVNTALNFDSNSIDNWMDYADYLMTRKKGRDN